MGQRSHFVSVARCGSYRVSSGHSDLGGPWHQVVRFHIGGSPGVRLRQRPQEIDWPRTMPCTCRPVYGACATCHRRNCIVASGQREARHLTPVFAARFSRRNASTIAARGCGPGGGGRASLAVAGEIIYFATLNFIHIVSNSPRRH